MKGNINKKIATLVGSIDLLEKSKEKLLSEVKREDLTQRADFGGIRDILGEIKREACEVIDAVDFALN